MNKTILEIQKLIDNQNNFIVCFDYFDTIVSRSVSPEEIKRAWATKCCYRFDLSTTWECLYQLRVSLEEELYHNPHNNYEFEYEFLMGLVYDKLNKDKICKARTTQEEFISFSVCCEMQIEKNVQYLNNDILEVIKACYDQKVKMAIVSDFYFDKDSFLDFLSHHRINHFFDNVFISSYYHSSKRKGSLYEIVKRSYPNYSYIMIGDNYYADVVQSQKRGFNAIGINRTKEQRRYRLFDQNSYSILKKKLQRIFDSSSSLSNYAFSLYLFTEKLYSIAVSDNIDCYYFLSRDGELLKILFDLYQEKNQFLPKINSSYLLVSRNATFLPGCKSLDEETFSGILNQYRKIKLVDFLYSLSFDEKQISAVLSSLSFNKNTMINVDDPSNVSSVLNRLFSDKMFQQYYERNRNYRKEAFNSYIKRTVCLSNDIHLVDVGWKGSIQDNIMNALDQKCKIIGYYYGLVSDTVSLSNNQKYGLMFNLEKGENIFSYDYWFIENVLTGSHKKVNSYSLDKGQVIIDYSNDSDSILYDLYIKRVREEIIQKFIQINELFRDTHFTSKDYQHLFYLLHFKLSRLYPIFDMKQNYIIRKIHSEGFGSIQNNTDISSKGYASYFIKNYGIKYCVSSLLEYIKLCTNQLPSQDF